MTGRDLIIYILANNLEDEPVFKGGRFIGFMTEDTAALIFGVGIATVHTWVRLGVLPSVQVGDRIYIPADSKIPSKGVEENG